MKQIVSLLLSVLAIACTNEPDVTPNLVPTKPNESANYWCTWYAQNYWIQRGGEISDFDKITNPAAREELTYDHLFNQEDGWVTNYLKRGRSDWYFLIDHGWQTKEAPERTLPGAKPFFHYKLMNGIFQNIRMQNLKRHYVCSMRKLLPMDGKG